MDTLPITLIVKAPNQQFEDQTIKCELSWSIRKLKGYLSEVYPCNPTFEEQKLIYSGQLLNDAHILKDILRQYEGQETHTVHLVLAPKNKFHPNAPQKKEMKPIPQKIAARAEATEGPRQRQFSANASQQPTTFSNAPRTSQHTAATIQSPTQYSTEQFVRAQQMAMHNMMHQMYLQYLNHYARASQSHFQADNSNSTGIPYFPQNLENGPFLATMMPPGVGRNMDELAAQPEPPVQPQPQNLQIDDEAESRDWLDILYTFSRLIVLLSLVYFYSSPGRCSIVILAMVLYYFYQNHQRNVRERQALENQQAAAIVIATPNDPDVQTENAQPEENSTNTGDNTSDVATENSVESESISTSTATAEPEENNRLVTVALLRTFVLSFFASLIPETPAV